MVWVHFSVWLLPGGLQCFCLFCKLLLAVWERFLLGVIILNDVPVFGETSLDVFKPRRMGGAED